jgi:transmembrane sensor
LSKLRKLKLFIVPKKYFWITTPLWVCFPVLLLLLVMDKSAIPLLLEKYRKGTITPEELAQLEDWYLHWQPEPMDVSAEELAELKAAVWQSLQPEHKRMLPGWSWAAAAAILAMLLGAGFYMMHLSSAKPPLAAHTQPASLPQPGGDRAMLTLSNGRKILLDKDHKGVVAQDADATIRQTGDGQIAYDQKNGKHGTELNTLTTPRGGQYHLSLADGTEVWLNAGSSITYPVNFDANERKVTVTGEAYFDVAQHAGQPFHVTAGKAEIAVLGTQFNIKAYSDDADVRTTLLSGSVKMNASILRPGQQGVLANNEISINTVRAEDVISWKNGYFIFDNMNLPDIMKLIGRWYDVDIVYKAQMDHETFGGTFSRNAQLSDMLGNLERLGKVHFEVQPGKIIITDRTH